MGPSLLHGLSEQRSTRSRGSTGCTVPVLKKKPCVALGGAEARLSTTGASTVTRAVLIMVTWRPMPSRHTSLLRQRHIDIATLIWEACHSCQTPISISVSACRKTNLRGFLSDLPNWEASVFQVPYDTLKTLTIDPGLSHDLQGRPRKLA